MSWQATAAPTLAGIPRIPSVFFAFASSETVHLACGEHADDESAREICAAEQNSAQLSLFLSPLSNHPEFSFFLGPIFISSLFLHFEEKSKHPEDRLKVNVVVIYLRRFLIFFFCSFVAKNSTFSFRLPASKFKHVSSTCIQPYFRKCHVVCQLTSLYLLMQTLSSVFAFNY